MFREFKQANSYALECRKYLITVPGLVGVAVLYFYNSLLAVPQLIQPLGEESTTLHRVAENQTQLQYWGYHAPINYQYNFDLVAVERCRILGQKAEAGELYDKAISDELYDKAISEPKANKYI
ncbi:hypothetical protein [Trichormus azollae]|uniref:hypothetical protein n=1 Tax=Trichormus azollae TaxID=1164 RepID=UPI00325C9A8D